MASNPNPQGKGLVPTLDAWQARQPVAVPEKSPRRVLSDYLTSLLVLSAEFNFRVVAGGRYHLYWRTGGWHLSLIAPEEWGRRDPGQYIGRCTLGRDMTWSLEPAEGLRTSDAALAALRDVQEDFLRQLDSGTPLEANLPDYAAQLPYARRLLAAGLAASVRQSLRRLGLDRARADEWRSLARTEPNLLPGVSGR